MRHSDISKILKIARVQKTPQHVVAEIQNHVENIASEVETLPLALTSDNVDFTTTDNIALPPLYNRRKIKFGGLNNEVITDDDGNESVILKDDRQNVFALYEMNNNIPTLTAVSQNPVFDNEKRHRLLNYTVTAIAIADPVIGRQKVGRPAKAQQIRFNSTKPESTFISTLRQIVSYTNRTEQYDTGLLNHIKNVDQPHELTNRELKKNMRSLEVYCKTSRHFKI